MFVELAAHGVCIRLRAVAKLARPISERRFGANKKYRGIVCAGTGTAIAFVAIRPDLMEEWQVHHLLIGPCRGLRGDAGGVAE
jgi:hypothetical protein